MSIWTSSRKYDPSPLADPLHLHVVSLGTRRLRALRTDAADTTVTAHARGDTGTDTRATCYAAGGTGATCGGSETRSGSQDDSAGRDGGKARIARPIQTLDEYKQALARHIFSSNAGRVVARDLQPLLRAVVVLQFHVDGSGTVRDVRTLRSPESAAERLARSSLERAGALPAPGSNVLHGGMVEVTET
ncbi:MAG: energy transducer TonB [Betaproteobacteria bacterium]|nr:energy transducer TonB [Betaproteobacteria bacterium]